MPEGPEIRRAADSIAAVLAGQPVREVYLGFPSLKRFEQRLRGAVVTAVDTHGKAMLTRFDNGLTLYSHNQLYGLWMTAPRDQPPQTGRSLRVALHTATHSALLYSASDVDVLTESELASHPFLSRLGPDILDPGLGVADVAARLDDARFRGRAVGSLYLDQSFLAGVGNYLRSEILFGAGVHPADTPSGLGRTGRRRLAGETLKISRRSYRTRGLTVATAEARALRRQGLSREQYRFRVFGREGLPCPACGAPIERRAVSGRGLFRCPDCQRPAPAR